MKTNYERRQIDIDMNGHKVKWREEKREKRQREKNDFRKKGSNGGIDGITISCFSHVIFY